MAVSYGKMLLLVASLASLAVKGSCTGDIEVVRQPFSEQKLALFSCSLSNSFVLFK
jgi:hypothetical protein